MTTNEIRFFFAYNRWANQRVLETVSALSAEQFTRGLSPGGGFRSVRDTIVHIMAGEAGWVAYWENPHTSLDAHWEHYTRLFEPSQFGNASEVEQKWREIESQQDVFLSRLTDETLSAMTPLGPVETTLAELMQHAANHCSYHRGQIALMLRQLGAVPVASDFCDYLLLMRNIG